jgi:hypothetical protein
MRELNHALVLGAWRRRRFVDPYASAVRAKLAAA